MDADPWCLNEKTSHLLPFVVNPVVVSSAGFLLDSSCAMCLLGINTRIPFVCNALKIWEVRNFPLDFLGQVRNIPRAEFSPAEKTPYRIPPPPPGRRLGGGFRWLWRYSEQETVCGRVCIECGGWR